MRSGVSGFFNREDGRFGFGVFCCCFVWGVYMCMYVFYQLVTYRECDTRIFQYLTTFGLCYVAIAKHAFVLSFFLF
jgi:hypothetical protein